MFTPGVGSNQY